MSDTPLLQVEALDKSFPGVHALDHVDFDLQAGEVHILLGENGAGKSTLMKILSGALTKDSGRILIDGREVEIGSTHQARQLGIGMVYQELTLFPTLTVAENIFVGHWLQGRRLPVIRWDKIYSRARELLTRVQIDLDPRTRVSELGMASRQMIEIAKALALDARVLLLDEPTSSLSQEEAAHLFELIRRLQARGVGIIYVTHRLGEVGKIGQRVTVLRDGKKIGTLPMQEATEGVMIGMMVGRELKELFPKEKVQRGDPILRIENVSAAHRLNNVNLTLHRGEILGIFGLVGAGRTELARMLFGLNKIKSGAVFVNGAKALIRAPRDAIRLGLGYLTEDRKGGLVQRLPIPPNITMGSLDHFSRFSILDHRAERREARRLVDGLQIHTRSLGQSVEYLSGGNQQKVALAKWLCSRSKILVFDEPTRGIDVGAKTEVYKLMNELVKEGAGIIMISSELPETLAMADRILVMANGTITAEYGRGGATQEDIMRKAVGR